MKLRFSGTPTDCFGVSLKQLIPKEEWDAIRKAVYRKNKWTCQICNRKSFNHDFPCHAHEEWSYHMTKDGRYRHLDEIMCLCPQCHQIKHIGRQGILLNKGKISNDEYELNFHHFAWVNNIDMEKTMDLFNDIESDAWDKMIFDEGYDIYKCLDTPWRHILFEYGNYESLLDDRSLVGFCVRKQFKEEITDGVNFDG